MNLYFVHCGFYDEEISSGIYEFHVNILVVASDVESAKKQVRMDSAFQKKKMHIDGIQGVNVVSGFEIKLQPSVGPEKTSIECHPHRDL